MTTTGWTQTFTGRKIHPLNPDPSEIYIEDIAHALSMICRFNGHCTRFYSVAEHSVRVARLVPPMDRLSALLHDASEAYLCDVARPIKPHLAGYAALESRMERAIATRFNAPYPWSAAIHKADAVMLATEANLIMREPPEPWGLQEQPIDAYAMGWSPDAADRAFMSAFNVYTS